MFRDVRYGGTRPRWRLIVELDGRLGHSSSRERDRDLERDLDAAVDREETVRLGYGQTFDRHCETARKLARIMHRLGWTGTPLRCPDCPDGGEQDRGIGGLAG
jgi:hypothetical protein